MAATLLTTDLCVHSNLPAVEEFRFAAYALNRSRKAMDRLAATAKRTTHPGLRARYAERRTIYLHDVVHPSYERYQDAFEAAYRADPDATMSIDRLYSR
jgi:hypothetical protein